MDAYDIFKKLSRGAKFKIKRPFTGVKNDVQVNVHVKFVKYYFIT